MGNNQAYTDWEKTVISAYNRKILSPEFLSELCEMHRGSDIDSGGKYGTLTKDGLDCEQVAIKVFGGNLPVEPKLPKDYKQWTDEQHEANDNYFDAIYAEFDRLVRKPFGWG